MKHSTVSVLRSIVYQIFARSLLDENRRLREELQRVSDVALTDALTGLFNRRALDDAMTAIDDGAKARGDKKRRPRRTPETYGFLAADLCRFKAVNDRFGHGGGDEALRAVAKAIRRSIREDDQRVFRPGGDEFVVLLYDVDIEESRVVAERIIRNIEAIPVWDLSARIGGAVWNLGEHPTANPYDVLKLADDLEVELRNEGRVGEADIRNFA
ncbi:MAG: GGDEF domain-containing protein [Patescibacteria group bacterium]